MILAFCSMLLHFASMPVPRALLGAGVAFLALFVEPLSTQLAPKIIKKNLSNINVFSFLCGALVNPTRPKNIKETLIKSKILTFGSMLLLRFYSLVDCLLMFKRF